MPTPAEAEKHSDHVWKVLIPELLIRIYRDHFSLADTAEAAFRMRNTPLTEDDQPL